MRNLIAIVIAVFGLIALAPHTTVAQEKMEFPAGHAQFISELSKLMAKYPKSAERFALRDKSSPPNQTKSAHHACCEWSCPWISSNPRDCRCSQICKE